MQSSTKSPIRTLCRAAALGYQRAETMRTARYRFMCQAAGPFFSKDKGEAGSDEKKASPINLMYQAMTTLVPNLVARNPQIKVNSDVLAYRQYGQGLAGATNTLIRRIRLAQSLRKTITDALFGPGFIKTGIAVSGQTLDLEDDVFEIGAPFADRVDPDDMILDPGARDWEEQIFVGNRFRVRKQTLLQSGLYDNGMIERLCSRYDGAKVKKEASSLWGDAQVLSEYNELVQFVDLQEIFLPAEGVIVTLPFGKDYEVDKPLRVVQYDGPERGPYHMLGFAWLGDNLLPVAPASIWYFLQVMGNEIARKIKRQSGRMKTVLAYEPSAEEDAAEIEQADDGETVAVENIQAIKEINFGGANEDAYKYMAWIEQQFSKNAGNIDLLAGTQAGEETLGQTELLQNNGQVRLGDMQGIVYDFTAQVCTDLAWFIHTDPLIELPYVKRVQGQEVQAIYTPEMREGDFFDYFLSVEPYSMKPVDPSTKARRVMEFITNGLPAIAQTTQLMAATLGPGVFNPEGAINVAVREIGLQETDEFINSQQMAQNQQMMMIQGPAPDGKLGAQMGMQQPGMMQQQPPAAPGVNVGQPNPMAMGQAGGTSPATEKRQGYQERSADIQAAR